MEPDAQSTSAQTKEWSAAQMMLTLDSTLLAWLRTALTLMGFGFTLARLVRDMLQHGMLNGVNPDYPRQLGFALMGLGMLTLGGGAFEYVRVIRKLVPGRTYWTVSLIVTLAVAVLSAILILSLVTEAPS